MSTISGTGTLDLDEEYRMLHVAIQTQHWSVAKRYCDNLYKKNFDDYLKLLKTGDQNTIKISVSHLNDLINLTEGINEQLLNQGENN